MSKGSAIAELAKGLERQSGSDEARTGAVLENPEEAAFAAELDLFKDQPIAPPKRGPGRPVGAADRSTVQLSAWMRAKGYRDPAEFLGAIVSMPLGDLIKLLPGSDAVEAVKLQVRAAEVLMPYVHRKRPIEVEHTGEGQRPLIIMHDDLRAMSLRGDGAMSIHDGEGNQTLINAVASGSQNRRSHDGE